MVKWRYNIEFPPQNIEKEKFSLGEKGVVVCPVCHSLYYKKSWHHAKRSLEDAQRSHRPKEALCPACQMIKDKEFEGQLTINGFPPGLKTDLIQLIKNFGQRAFERDPLDRLIDIKTDAGRLVVTTTENQLAVKLAKKIKEVFSKYKIQLKISYSPEPSDTAYIKINFAD
jgi:hypothetical protein